jgi:hypothetical protein
MGSMLSTANSSATSAPARTMLLQSTHLQDLPYGKCAPEHVEAIIKSTLHLSGSHNYSNSAVV